jgi:hypothetical protein
MSLEKLVSEFVVFKKQTAELAKELRKNFPPLFVQLFKKHTWVESFSWRQCEPWRDGEETEFEVLCDAEQLIINDLNSYDDGVYGDEEKKKVYEEFADALEEVPTEVMKAMFGESNEVEVKKSGEIFVTEYSDG